jgi:hypothetical protein
MPKALLFLLYCCLVPALAFGAVPFAAPPEHLNPVTIEGSRERDEMPLSRFIAGEKMFAEQKSMAPTATLRFMIVPRDPQLSLDRIDLTLIDPNAPKDHRSIEIPFDAQGVFDIPAGNFSRDTMIRSSLPPNSLHWRPLVQTPGVDPDARRLGDLRLECVVKEAGELNRPDLPFFSRLFGGGSISECNSPDQHLFLAPRALAGATLQNGTHQAPIDADRLKESSEKRLVPRTYYVFEEGWRPRAYSPPLGDASWPDDTLVRFTYLNSPTASN